MQILGRVVAAVFNKSIANATTDVLPANITPSTYASSTPSTVVGQVPMAYRITVSVDTGVKLHLRYTDGSTTVDAPFNADAVLAASGVYTFTVSLPRYAAVGAGAGAVTAMSFNFQLSGAATVNYLIVDEIPGAKL